MAAVIAGLVFAALVLRVFYSSMQTNGALLGIIVAIFKIAASLLLVLIALMGLARDERGRLNLGLLGILVAGVSGWALYRLINEEAVIERRRLTSPE